MYLGTRVVVGFYFNIRTTSQFIFLTRFIFFLLTSYTYDFGISKPHIDISVISQFQFLKKNYLSVRDR